MLYVVLPFQDNYFGKFFNKTRLDHYQSIYQ